MYHVPPQNHLGVSPISGHAHQAHQDTLIVFMQKKKRTDALPKIPPKQLKLVVNIPTYGENPIIMVV